MLIRLQTVIGCVLIAAMVVTGGQIASAAEAEPVLLGTAPLLTGIPGKGPLTEAQIRSWLAEPKNHVVLNPELPLGLSAGQSKIVGLDANPLTRAKIELGRQLYFDTRLSADNTISCASCHHPDQGYGAHTRFGVGIQGQEGGRNSPVSYNRIVSGPQFWDGRAASLEEQAKGPIANPIEMGNTHEKCIATLKKIPGYVLQFEAVFGSGSVNIDNVAKAIAAFERCLVTGPSPYDYFEKFAPFAKMSAEDLADLKEDDAETYQIYEELLALTKKSPMSDSAKRGRELFFSERVNCTACHVGANLADELYHNLGIGMDQPKPDLGRYEVTKVDKDKGAFKTPTIRNVALSAPYMHDGSLKTLLDTVEHYNKGGTPNPWLSDKVKPLKLTSQEKQDLVAFMEACSGSFPQVEQGRLP
ncbi:MAG: cytochrome c peroxidase [Planctomycetaceae bacterium]|nr:cytochrome c peroxidase [Planctomycetaceae bacterium]